jgi:XTP/dITP diphosphohydrolase
MDILFASHNKNKMSEAQALIDPSHSLRPIDEAVQWDENGQSYLENALIKLKACWNFYGARSCIAEDTGLEVDALGGRPGLYSARYSSTPVTTLLAEMTPFHDLAQRSARFICVLTYVDASTGECYAFEGRYEGLIALSPQGEGGFGYDPVFYCPKMQCTFAQMQEKTLLSHRAQAIHAWQNALKNKTLPKACAHFTV